MAGVEGVSAEKKIAGQAGNDAESQAGNDAMDKSRREVARLRPGHAGNVRRVDGSLVRVRQLSS